MAINQLQSENYLVQAIKIIIAFIILTPLILSSFTISFSSVPKIFYFRTLTEIIFILYLILIGTSISSYPKKYLPRISPLFLAVSGFIIILIISSLFSFNPWRSFWGEPTRSEGLILHIHLFVFFLILISIFKNKQDWFALLKLTVIISALSSLAGIFQKFGVFSFYGADLPNRISGTMVNPNFFGYYLVLNIFLALFLFWTEKGGLKIFWLLISGLNCFTLILSGTRGAWMGALAGFLFLFFIWLFSFLRKAKLFNRKMIIFAVLVFCFLIFLLVLKSDFYLTENYFVKRFLTIFNPDIIGGRLAMSRIAFDSFKDRPILGWGLESYSFVFDKYFRVEYLSNIPESAYFDYPHNKIMGLASSVGILGLLFYFSIFITVFYLLFRKDNSGIKQEEKIIKGNHILASFFIAGFIQNISGFDTISTYLLFFLVLGFINNKINKPAEVEPLQIYRGSTSVNLRIKLFFVFASTLLSLFTFYQINVKPARAGFYFSQGFKYEMTNPEQSLLDYKKAISQKTIYDKDFRLFMAERLVYILENSWAKEEKTQAEIIKTLSELKPYFEENLEEPDRRYLAYYKYVCLINQRIYLFSQDKDSELLDEIEQVSKRALKFNSSRPEFYRLIGETEIFKGNEQEGERYFEKAFELGPQTYQARTDYYKNLGVAYLKIEDNQKAGLNFKKAIDRDYYLRKFNPSAGLFLEGLERQVRFTYQVANFFYIQLNDSETCFEIYEKAIEIYPSHQKILESYLQAIKQKEKK